MDDTDERKSEAASRDRVGSGGTGRGASRRRPSRTRRSESGHGPREPMTHTPGSETGVRRMEVRPRPKSRTQSLSRRGQRRERAPLSQAQARLALAGGGCFGLVGGFRRRRRLRRRRRGFALSCRFQPRDASAASCSALPGRERPALGGAGAPGFFFSDFSDFFFSSTFFLGASLIPDSLRRSLMRSSGLRALPAS